MNKRLNQKIDVFINILEGISTLSTSSSLKVAAIMLKRDFSSIPAFGYNGSYKNCPINEITGTEEESNEPGKSGFVHAEMNMLIKSSVYDRDNYIVFLTHSPCNICSKLLINAGIKYVYWVNEYRETSHLDLYFKDNLLGWGSIADLKNDDKKLNEIFRK